jgi:hypothetical protein
MINGEWLISILDECDEKTTFSPFLTLINKQASYLRLSKDFRISNFRISDFKFQILSLKSGI